jgi:hypothetical protein
VKRGRKGARITALEVKGYRTRGRLRPENSPRFVFAFLEKLRKALILDSVDRIMPKTAK